MPQDKDLSGKGMNMTEPSHAAESITEEQIQELSQIVKDFRCDQQIYTDEDYNGYKIAVIESISRQAPDLLVSGKKDQIELSMMFGEDFRALGCFGCMSSLAFALIDILNCSKGMTELALAERKIAA